MTVRTSASTCCGSTTRRPWWATSHDLAQVEQMLGSLRSVAPDDPRLEKYGTD